jgi:hypothetical protein
MKKSLFPLVLFLLLFSFSCSGGGGGGSSNSGGGSALSCGNNGVPIFSMSADREARVDLQFTEKYSWCDSDSDITEFWYKSTFRGVVTTNKFNATDYGITGSTGTQENKYTWTSSSSGDYFIDFWVRDAKGNVSNTVSIIITAYGEEMGLLKVPSSVGIRLVEKAIQGIK